MKNVVPHHQYVDENRKIIVSQLGFFFTIGIHFPKDTGFMQNMEDIYIYDQSFNMSG